MSKKDLKAITERMQSELNTFESSAASWDGRVQAKEIRGKNDSSQRQGKCIAEIETRDGSKRNATISISPRQAGVCSQIDAMALNSDGTTIAIGIIGSSFDGNIDFSELQIWEFAPIRQFFSNLFQQPCSSWHKVRTIEAWGQLDGVKFSATDKYLAFRDGYGINVLDVQNGDLLYRFIRGDSGRPSAPTIVFSPDEQWIASNSGPTNGPARWRLGDDILIETVRSSLPVWLEGLNE